MAEYLIQDTTLTAIAGAIRSKTKTTDAILAADMAELIAGIEAGGGAKIASGTIVLSEPSSHVEFVHEFGEGVNFFAIFTLESTVSSSTGLFSALISRKRCIASRNNSSGSRIVNIGVGTNTGSSSDNTSVIGKKKDMNTRSYDVWDDNNKLVIDGFMEDGMMYRLKDGVEYMWFATTWSEN